MKIGLMGFEFVSPNKGCEALSYSFLWALEKMFNENEKIEIYNFTRCNLGLIPKYFSTFDFRKINISFRNISIRYFKNFHDCDIIFDVTMGDSFSDIYSYKYYKKLILEKKIAELFGKRYVLLPQTYGPFINQRAKKKAKNILKNATKIYCRDEMSQLFLEENFSIKNSELTTDMAFMLPYDKMTFLFAENDKMKIGINVSGMLYFGGFNHENQFGLTVNYQEYIDCLLTYFLGNGDKFEVFVIPHVIDLSENSYDDDYKVSENLKMKYPSLVVAPAFSTPVEAKSYISNMDIFIGSRMHSTIAAFSSGVITIPVSYSRKFEGLYSSLNYPYVVNAKEETTESAFSKTISYIEKKHILKANQERAIKRIESLQDEFVGSLGKLLK